MAVMTRNDGRNGGYNGDEAGNTAIYQYTVLTVFENPGKSFDWGKKCFRPENSLQERKNKKKQNRSPESCKLEKRDGSN